MALTEASVPVEIRREKAEGPAGAGSALTIVWSSGEQVTINSVILRRNCPCANCIEKNKQSGVEPVSPPKLAGRASLRVIAATMDQAVNLTEVWPIGNYAIGLRFGDGHDSGIYSYALLRELSGRAGK